MAQEDRNGLSTEATNPPAKFTWRREWATDTDYLTYDTFRFGRASYIALSNHTSTSVAADLISGVIELFVDGGLDGASGSGSGDMLGSNNLSEIANDATARANIGAAAAGANGDITSFTQAINFDQDASFDQDVTVAQSLTVSGPVTLGDAGTDTVTIAGEIVVRGVPGADGQVLVSRGDNAAPEWVDTSALPPGTVIDFAGSAAPTGFLACPVSATNISRTTYAALFAAIGTLWGAGDGSTTFGMPYYPANYASVQASGNVGTSTVGDNLSHVHQEQNVTAGGILTPATRKTGASGSFDTIGVSSISPGNSGAIALNTLTSGGSANLAAGMRNLKCVKY